MATKKTKPKIKATRPKPMSPKAGYKKSRYDGIVFNRWYADMCYTGVAIDWEDML